MAYAVIQFVEGDERKVTLCRTDNGQPTGEEGVMNLIGGFINEWSTLIAREGSPGAERLAMIFAAEEDAAGREVRVVGSDGPLGISPAEVEALEGQGYYYEVLCGRPGERNLPGVLQRAIGDGG